jgi:hypothetical protein
MIHQSTQSSMAFRVLLEWTRQTLTHQFDKNAQEEWGGGREGERAGEKKRLIEF